MFGYTLTDLYAPRDLEARCGSIRRRERGLQRRGTWQQEPCCGDPHATNSTFGESLTVHQIRFAAIEAQRVLWIGADCKHDLLKDGMTRIPLHRRLCAAVVYFSSTRHHLQVRS